MNFLLRLGLIPILYASFAYSCSDQSTACSRLKKFCFMSSIKRNCPITCDSCITGTTIQPTSAPEPTLPASTGPRTCGQRQIASGKVIAGTNARKGDWPWQILLIINGSPGCGGSIISKRYVVTAAHCVARSQIASRYKVVVGEHDRNVDEGTEQTIDVERVIVHRKYDPYYLNNDIALLKLASDITFTPFVQPVCLPNADIPIGYGNCFITGWGKIVHPGRMHTYLQQASMTPVGRSTCAAKNNKVSAIPVTESMQCAGDGGQSRKSGCHGDSGGPYVCNVGGAWELHGAVSWGSRRCSSTETYTVFAKVNYFKSWIETAMKVYGDN